MLLNLKGKYSNVIYFNSINNQGSSNLLAVLDKISFSEVLS